MGRDRTLAKLGFAMIILLVGQYMLGMYSNLFVQIPDGVDGWKWMSNSLVIMGHVTLGTLVLVVSGAGLALSVRARARSWVLVSIVGLLGIGASLFGGSAFMNGQSDTMSFVMACGLGVAILAYAAGVYAWALATSARQLAAG
jgi:ABC-type maltose transport system permease subunit